MSRNKNKRHREIINTACETQEKLHDWVSTYLGLNVPRKAVCAHHVAPFEYLKRAYFEPAGDVVVWASRGGGKTRLGAAATMLDLLHKRGVQVRILGGSMEQSLRMWEHLVPDLERCQVEHQSRTFGSRMVELWNRSRAAVLPQSQRAVRGLRVQKLRCDEVDEFEPEVWDAAQLITKSAALERANGLKVRAGEMRPVAGVVEALSTFHNAWGQMSRVVDRAGAAGTPVMKWCVLDVLEKCPPERQCATCPLWEDCGGRAKTECDGFFSIDEAIVQKRRVSLETWKSEMLCERPSTRGAVFKSFSRERHVRETDVDGSRVREWAWGIDFGFVNPFVCLWIAVTHDGEVHVVDEYVRRERVMHENLAAMESRGRARPAWVGCDPAGSSRNEQTAQSNVDLLRRRGYRVRTCGSRIVDGIEKVRFALQPAAGAPVLFVNARCAELIKALECYHYDPAARGENPKKDGEHDHLIDALRYFFVNRGRGQVTVRARY
jgi:hypothetical protein